MSSTYYPSDLTDIERQHLEPLLPAPKSTGRPREWSLRLILNGIFYLWKALDATGMCKGSTAHSRLQEWEKDGFFVRLWEAALCDYDELKGLDWSWLALDGAMTKAPLGGGKPVPTPRTAPKAASKKSLDRSGGPSGGAGD